jgi:acyl-CoA hydrolase
MADYRKKLVSPEEAVKAVHSGDWVEYGFSCGFPELLDRALAALKDDLSDVKIRGGLVQGNYKIQAVEQDPEQKTFQYYSWHLGAYERGLYKKGLVQFMPVILRNLPFLYRQELEVDVAFVPVSRPDENGWFGLGLSNYCWKAIIEKAKTVIFEVNEKYPVFQGVDHSHAVHADQADFIVEGEHSDLPVSTYRDPSDADLRIAELTVNEIPDEACLSLGVGTVPFTVCRMLAESGRKNLGCHTGTISDAFMMLYEKGKLTNTAKEFDQGRFTWNLAAGTPEFYDWLGRHGDLFHPDCLDYVHSPERMGHLSNFISINGGVQIDLLGQENAETAGTRQLSGIGGQLDFLEGAFRSEGGKGFICINSTHKKKDGTLQSNIVPCIPAGSTVSGPRTMIHNVVTEYGVAHLAGRSVREKAQELISIAHPDFRDELTKYMMENLK